MTSERDDWIARTERWREENHIGHEERSGVFRAWILRPPLGLLTGLGGLAASVYFVWDIASAPPPAVRLVGGLGWLVILAALLAELVARVVARRRAGR